MGESFLRGLPAECWRLLGMPFGRRSFDVRTSTAALVDFLILRNIPAQMLVARCDFVACETSVYIVIDLLSGELQSVHSLMGASATLTASHVYAVVRCKALLMALVESANQSIRVLFDGLAPEVPSRRIVCNRGHFVWINTIEASFLF